MKFPYRHSPDIPSELPLRSREWRLRTRALKFNSGPRWMGILNVTPDSFSDGGQYMNPPRAIERGLELIEEGADILDIGGESTRPYSKPVTDQEELGRVLPVIEGLASRADVAISIDTSKASVAREAIAAGAEILNDVTGLEGDPEMARLALETGAGICAMHMQGTPQTMQQSPRYEDVVREIHDYLAYRRDYLLRLGIEQNRICLDPGIGFGKTHQHNLELMKNCWRFHDLGCPVLVGHSRKGFLGKLVGTDGSRNEATVGASIALAMQGVQVIRVHQVRHSREALLAFLACHSDMS